MKTKFKNYFLALYYVIFHPVVSWRVYSTRTKKRIIRVTAVILIVMISIPASLWYQKYRANVAEAAWWNDLWLYRKSITISNSSGSELTDFQVKILDNKDLTADITAGKIQSDLDDLRFTDLNGNILPFWIEDNTTSSVDVWIKAPRLPTTGATFYMYYGNTQATALSNGNKVFEFFDDFSGSSIDTDKWTPNSVNNITYSLASGNLRITDATKSSNTYWIYDNTDTGSQHRMKYGITDNVVVEWKSTLNDVSAPEMGEVGFGLVDSSNLVRSYLYYSDGQGGSLNPQRSWFYETTTGAESSSANETKNFKITRSGSTVKHYIDGSLKQTGTLVGSPNGISLAVGAYGGYSFLNYVDVDYVFTHKYASSDPSAGTPASEEKGTAPIAYWSFDEGTGTTAYDGTSNGKNGTLTNMSSTPDASSGWQMGDKCVSGNCVGFDNVDDGVSVASQNFTSLTDYTMCAWINPKGNHKNYTGTIMSSGDWNNTHWAFGVSQNNTSLQTRKVDGVNFPSWSYTFPLNKWSYACITRSGTSIQAYVDGKNIGSYTGTTGNLISNATNTMIGRETYAGGYFDFNGKIDEPKIYNYARSINQIKNDYNAGVAGMAKANEGTEASVGAKSPAWLTQGLVGHWKMDEASWNGTSGEVKDASGNSNNGTATGNATTAAAKFGNGGTFDGTGDYVSVADSSNYTLSDLTLSAWVKTNDDVGELVSHFTSGSPWVGFTMNIGENGGGSSGKLCFWTSSGSGNGWNCSSRTVNDNNWHLLSVTFKSSGSTGTAKYYIDGTLDTTITKNTPGDGDNPLKFGQHNDGGRDYNGSLDDVRIYNRALSPQEVGQLSNYAPGPVGYWNMDEGSGATAKDLSGNGNNGSFVNGPTWAAGKYGGAVSLPGSGNYVQASFTNIASNYTIEGWVNLNSFPSGSDPNRAGGLMGGNSCSNSGNVEFILGNNATTPQIGLGRCGDFSTLFSSKTLNLNTWAFVTATVDSSKNITYYINGANAGTANGSSYDLSIKTPIIFGDNILRNFNGQIDEVRIYNYVRTSKQITEDMNAGHPAGGSPVGSQVAYWKLDEGQGNTAYDSSSKGHNGTLENAPTRIQDGKIGRALQFLNPGAQYGQYVDVTDSTISQVDANLKLNDSLTFTMWINPNATQTTSGRIFSNGSGGTNHQYIAQLANYTNGKYGITYTFNNGTSYYYFSTSAKFIPSDAWSHLAIICKYQTYCSTYLNGNFIETTNTVYTGDAVLTNYFGIGGRSGGYDGIQAKMDEFKIYNYALTADDIKLDFNQGKSLVLGSAGTASDGKTMDFSAARGYCPPGNTEGNCGAGQNPAPVGEWTMNDGTGGTAKDTSGNNNNGTLTNGPTWDLNGKIGRAVSFTGNQYITIPDNNALDFGSGDYTISAWVRPSSLAQMTGYERIVRKRATGANTGYYIGFDNNSGANVIQCGIYDGSWKTATYGSALSDNTWSYLTCVFSASGSYIKAYKNGQLKQTYSGSLGDVSNDGALQIAGTSDGTDQWEGTIDDVKLFGYAKTPSQVAWDYNRGAPIGWWKFDEGQGSTAHDFSGNANDGTLTNMDPPNDWVDGKNNKALDFDGSNDGVEMGDVSIFNFGNNPFSISAWFYPTATNNYRTIMGKGGFWATNEFQMYILNGNLYFYVDKAGSKFYTPVSPITANRWYHAVGIYDGSYIKLYVNGNYIGQTSVNNLNLGNTTAFKVGRASGDLFVGKIDDPRVYNYALSGEQVKQVMNEGAVNFR